VQKSYQKSKKNDHVGFTAKLNFAEIEDLIIHQNSYIPSTAMSDEGHSSPNQGSSIENFELLLNVP